jgi:hypothetical protein
MNLGPVLARIEPLQGGRETEIDMIEREMEGGVVIIQPLEIHEHSREERLGGLVGVEEHVDVHEMRAMPSGEPTT